MGETEGLRSPLPDLRVQEQSNGPSDYPPHSIAIVGMSGRFPDADSVDELWELLLEGKSTVKPAPVERLQLPQSGNHRDTKWWGNFLRDPECFDHRFFKKPSREAIAWDPQQKILLEVVYEALESAGHFGPSSTVETDDYGCYIGAVMNNYYDNMTCHPPTAYATLGTSRPFLSGVMSHHFGFTGPSLTIDTACSSSLVAINTACRAIWSGECSRAIAGGTNVISSPFDYQNLHAAGLLSPTGQCKPFDAAADGYCRGEAVAVVVLKPLSDAIKDNNDILGVIVGSAANQNRNFSHITVPHADSQAELYEKVMKLGKVEPESVSYVEAHGTGTGVGDPVEVNSIRDAFGGPQRDSLLHFGSIKGNIGHTEASAGVSGLIKVLLMMKYGQIPKQGSYSVLNPKLPDFRDSRMEIPTTTLPWNPSTRIACVNSHGAAGSNSAVLVREKPPLNTRAPPAQLSRYPLFISAGSANSLSTYARKLLEWLEKSKKSISGGYLLASLTFTLADRGNHALPYIFSTSVSGIKDLETNLKAACSGSGIRSVDTPKPLVLVFGGQEGESIGLSRGLYDSSKIFRSHIDDCDKHLVSNGCGSLYPAIFTSKPIEDIVALHSALFAVQYASAKTWIDCGLKVEAVIGHSFGLLTAFCISGTLSLADALTLVIGRASLMQRHWSSERGAMLSVQAESTVVEKMLRSLESEDSDFYAEIACYNGPKSHVVVGTTLSIEALEKHITNTTHFRNSVRFKRLNVTHGFHSQFVEPILPHLTDLAQTLTWSRPVLHLETCEEEHSVWDPDHTIVLKHTRSPVFFQKGIERLAKTLRSPRITWLEAGRGSSAMSLVRVSVPSQQGHIFLSPLIATPDAIGSLTDISIDLWNSGHAVQFWPFHRSEKQGYEQLILPRYQFEKTKHWLPFTGRTSKKEIVKNEADPEKPIPILHLTHMSENGATFQINPRSDRFQAMLAGHVMAGESLAPASLYFELVTRAALLLQKDTEAKRYVPRVDDLRMKSPIGRDTSKGITLQLNRADITNPTWSFSITATARAFPTTEPYEHCTGRVTPKQRDDAQAAREFKRFESLTGHRRYSSVIDHPTAETMKGNHIYRAFSTVVHYGPAFHGINKIACVQHEAAGTVSITPDMAALADQRICDTPMTDSFMQFSGFLVNYFNNSNLEDVFVCGEIERIEMGGKFSPDAKNWIVYSTMAEDRESGTSADVYVFEAESKNLVMAVLGCRFSKISKTLLGEILKNSNQPERSSSVAPKPSHEAVETARTAVQNGSILPSSRSLSKRSEIFNILSSITDIPQEDIDDDSTLDDLGIDSLMATEVLNDIRTTLGLTLDLSNFLFFRDIRALVRHIDGLFGIGGESEIVNTPSTSSSDQDVSDLYCPEASKLPTPVQETSTPRPEIRSAVSSFEQTRLEYDQLAKDTKALGFWSDAYPPQARLVLAYVVEAFEKLGCNLAIVQPGGEVCVQVLPQHAQLLQQLYRILEDGNLISPIPTGYVRSTTPVDETPAEIIYQQLLGLHPQNDDVSKLIRAVGSRMAPCLTGTANGIQVLFGDKDTKRTLEAMYEFWPLLRTATLLLGNFLTKAFSNATGEGKFRILEVGAGTGGTTKYIVRHLKDLGIPFEYVFSDISASLVAAARKKFKEIDEMTFEILDIEKPVRPEHEGAFHCIIATNCIHATRNLEVTLSHLREMLREDGALTLIEITKHMFWLDIVVGLLEGWWLFDDGRSHALVDEEHWGRALKKSGFSEVLWSDGVSPESKTVRVIGAFPRGDSLQSNGNAEPRKPINADVETVVYKRVGDLEIHADIYYPSENKASKSKLPIALMIHGGSHVMFSRKDIRPPQTRLLLEKGFLPVSLDHRLCPEVSLSEGPMVDICDALRWARHTLPYLDHRRPWLEVDSSKVVVVGWSSGGQLAMSLAWTAPQRNLRPPEAILAFYCPTNYDDPWWRHPIQPIGAADKGYQYDVLEAIQDKPITNYGVVGAWEPLSDPRILTDPRCRIALHINWKAQTLPVILGGLPSRRNAAQYPDCKDWNKLPQPSHDKVIDASAIAQIRMGNYQTPTFLIHGTADDLVPWQQSRDTYEAMVEKNIPVELVLLEGAPHICDLSSDPSSDGWKAVVRGYDFLGAFV
uniref:G12668 n=1 Tax=Sporormiella sp. TaxID=2012087 RepID=A0AAU8H3S3_9PLEO